MNSVTLCGAFPSAIRSSRHMKNGKCKYKSKVWWWAQTSRAKWSSSQRQKQKDVQNHPPFPLLIGASLHSERDGISLVLLPWRRIIGTNSPTRAKLVRFYGRSAHRLLNACFAICILWRLVVSTTFWAGEFLVLCSCGAVERAAIDMFACLRYLKRRFVARC